MVSWFFPQQALHEDRPPLKWPGNAAYLDVSIVLGQHSRLKDIDSQFALFTHIVSSMYTVACADHALRRAAAMQLYVFHRIFMFFIKHASAMHAPAISNTAAVSCQQLVHLKISKVQAS